eukprot:9407814-Ditylum_brightwellii.AAC.1
MMLLNVIKKLFNIKYTVVDNRIWCHQHKIGIHAVFDDKLTSERSNEQGNFLWEKNCGVNKHMVISGQYR